MSGSTGLTAEVIALALVGACRAINVPFEKVFEPGMRARAARALAVDALRRRGWGAAAKIAPLLKVHAPEAAPSMLFKAGIGVEIAVGLAEALPLATVASASPKPIVPKHPPRRLPQLASVPVPVIPQPKVEKPPAELSSARIAPCRAPRVRLAVRRGVGQVFKGVVRSLVLDERGNRQIIVRFRSGLRVRTWLSSEADPALKVGARAELIYDGDVWLVGAAA